MKKPWTSGPWKMAGHLIGDQNGRWWAKFASRKNNRQDAIDNALVASKAPEMAELLIELVKKLEVAWDLDDFYGEAIESLYEKAICLLKEVGYEA